ncbi:uncharacterized protein LOC143289489 [Babylonia areolata]|uniref:uncharacterized protein LOC143289489 n=1 Tax=Babylonia areolata TaxID=304850 RepID=UPI003FD3D3F0
MVSLRLVLAVLTVCLCQHSWARFGFMARPQRHQRGWPRCTSSSRPCRLRAELQGNDPTAPSGNAIRRVISRQLCSCPSSMPCSTHWSSTNHRVISRELRTNGNINMTFSMMFCAPVRPELQAWCGQGDVALRLKGLTSVPTEVESMPCTCTDRRPLVLHRTYRGPDFLQYDDYVCANHKRRCNVEWSPDICLIHNMANQTDSFPCKCPQHTVCRSTSDMPFNKDFRCLPVQ